MTEPSQQRNSLGEMYLATADRAESPDPRALYETELTYVWNTLRRLGISPSDLEDRAHDVFMTAIERLPTFDRARPIRPWLFGIAFRVVVGARRALRTRSEVTVADPEGIDDAQGPEALACTREEVALLHDALAEVPLERRAVVLMHDLEDFPIPEIATALNLRLNTAYSRLRVGRAELTEAVRRLSGRRR